MNSGKKEIEIEYFKQQALQAVAAIPKGDEEKGHSLGFELRPSLIRLQSRMTPKAWFSFMLLLADKAISKNCPLLAHNHFLLWARKELEILGRETFENDQGKYEFFDCQLTINSAFCTFQALSQQNWYEITANGPKTLSDLKKKLPEFINNLPDESSTKTEELEQNKERIRIAVKRIIIMARFCFLKKNYDVAVGVLEELKSLINDTTLFPDEYFSTYLQIFCLSLEKCKRKPEAAQISTKFRDFIQNSMTNSDKKNQFSSPSVKKKLNLFSAGLVLRYYEKNEEKEDANAKSGAKGAPAAQKPKPAPAAGQKGNPNDPQIPEQSEIEKYLTSVGVLIPPTSVSNSTDSKPPTAREANQKPLSAEEEKHLMIDEFSVLSSSILDMATDLFVESDKLFCDDVLGNQINKIIKYFCNRIISIFGSIKSPTEQAELEQQKIEQQKLEQQQLLLQQQNAANKKNPPPKPAAAGGKNVPPPNAEPEKTEEEKLEEEKIEKEKQEKQKMIQQQIEKEKIDRKNELTQCLRLFIKTLFFSSAKINNLEQCTQLLPFLEGDNADNSKNCAMEKIIFNTKDKLFLGKKDLKTQAMELLKILESINNYLFFSLSKSEFGQSTAISSTIKKENFTKTSTMTNTQKMKKEDETEDATGILYEICEAIYPIFSTFVSDVSDSGEPKVRLDLETKISISELFLELMKASEWKNFDVVFEMAFFLGKEYLKRGQFQKGIELLKIAIQEMEIKRSSIVEKSSKGLISCNHSENTILAIKHTEMIQMYFKHKLSLAAIEKTSANKEKLTQEISKLQKKQTNSKVFGGLYDKDKDLLKTLTQTVSGTKAIANFDLSTEQKLIEHCADNAYEKIILSIEIANKRVRNSEKQEVYEKIISYLNEIEANEKAESLSLNENFKVSKKGYKYVNIMLPKIENEYFNVVYSKISTDKTFNLVTTDVLPVSTGIAVKNSSYFTGTNEITIPLLKKNRIYRFQTRVLNAKEEELNGRSQSLSITPFLPLPLAFLWCLLAESAYKNKCFDTSKTACEKVVARFFTFYKFDPIWEYNPIKNVILNLGSENNDNQMLIGKISAILLILGNILLSETGDKKKNEGEGMKKKEQSGQLLKQQKKRLKYCAYFILSLELSLKIQDSFGISVSIKQALNCLQPLLFRKSLTPHLIDPLIQIAKAFSSLTTKEVENDENFQVQLVSLLVSLVRCIESVPSSSVGTITGYYKVVGDSLSHLMTKIPSVPKKTSLLTPDPKAATTKTDSSRPQTASAIASKLNDKFVKRAFNICLNPLVFEHFKMYEGTEGIEPLIFSVIPLILAKKYAEAIAKINSNPNSSVLSEYIIYYIFSTALASEGNPDAALNALGGAATTTILSQPQYLHLDSWMQVRRNETFFRKKPETSESNQPPAANAKPNAAPAKTATTPRPVEPVAPETENKQLTVTENPILNQYDLDMEYFFIQEMRIVEKEPFFPVEPPKEVKVEEPPPQLDPKGKPVPAPAKGKAPEPVVPQTPQHEIFIDALEKATKAAFEKKKHGFVHKITSYILNNVMEFFKFYPKPEKLSKIVQICLNNYFEIMSLNIETSTNPSVAAASNANQQLDTKIPWFWIETCPDSDSITIFPDYSSYWLEFEFLSKVDLENAILNLIRLLFVCRNYESIVEAGNKFLELMIGNSFRLKVLPFFVKAATLLKIDCSKLKIEYDSMMKLFPPSKKELIEVRKSFLNLFGLMKNSKKTEENNEFDNAVTKTIVEYESSTAILRKKNEIIFIIQAMNELGDLYYISDDKKSESVKLYTEGLDSCFEEIDVIDNYVKFLKKPDYKSISSKLGLKRCIFAILFAGKLANYYSEETKNHHLAAKYYVLISEIVKSICSFSIEFPQRFCDANEKSQSTIMERFLSFTSKSINDDFFFSLHQFVNIISETTTFLILNRQYLRSSIVSKFYQSLCLKFYFKDSKKYIDAKIMTTMSLIYGGKLKESAVLLQELILAVGEISQFGNFFVQNPEKAKQIVLLQNDKPMSHSENLKMIEQILQLLNTPITSFEDRYGNFLANKLKLTKISFLVRFSECFPLNSVPSKQKGSGNAAKAAPGKPPAGKPTDSTSTLDKNFAAFLLENAMTEVDNFLNSVTLVDNKPKEDPNAAAGKKAPPPNPKAAAGEAVPEKITIEEKVNLYQFFSHAKAKILFISGRLKDVTNFSKVFIETINKVCAEHEQNIEKSDIKLHILFEIQLEIFKICAISEMQQGNNESAVAICKNGLGLAKQISERLVSRHFYYIIQLCELYSVGEVSKKPEKVKKILMENSGEPIGFTEIDENFQNEVHFGVNSMLEAADKSKYETSWKEMMDPDFFIGKDQKTEFENENSKLIESLEIFLYENGIFTTEDPKEIENPQPSCIRQAFRSMYVQRDAVLLFCYSLLKFSTIQSMRGKIQESLDTVLRIARIADTYLAESPPQLKALLCFNQGRMHRLLTNTPLSIESNWGCKELNNITTYTKELLVKTKENAELSFLNSVKQFQNGLATCFSSSFHDHFLMHSFCIELSYLYGSKIVKDEQILVAQTVIAASFLIIAGELHNKARCLHANLQKVFSQDNQILNLDDIPSLISDPLSVFTKQITQNQREYLQKQKESQAPANSGGKPAAPPAAQKPGAAADLANSSLVPSRILLQFFVSKVKAFLQEPTYFQSNLHNLLIKTHKFLLETVPPYATECLISSLPDISDIPQPLDENGLVCAQFYCVDNARLQVAEVGDEDKFQEIARSRKKDKANVPFLSLFYCLQIKNPNPANPNEKKIPLLGMLRFEQQELFKISGMLGAFIRKLENNKVEIGVTTPKTDASQAAAGKKPPAPAANSKDSAQSSVPATSEVEKEIERIKQELSIESKKLLRTVLHFLTHPSSFVKVSHDLESAVIEQLVDKKFTSKQYEILRRFFDHSYGCLEYDIDVANWLIQILSTYH